MIARAIFLAVAGLLALILVVAALVFLLAALYFWLRESSLTPAESALVVGVAALVVAGLILWAARWQPRRPRPVVAGTGFSASDMAFKLGGSMAEEVVRTMEARPYRSVAAALLAGLAIGGSASLRKFLKNLVVR